MAECLLTHYSLLLMFQIQFDDGRVEDGGVVGVEGDFFFGIERHARFAAFGEGDQIAVAGTEVIVNDQRFGRFAFAASEGEAIHHLHEQESAADEGFVNGLQADSADDQSYPHVDNSWRDLRASSESSRLALTNRAMRLRIC